MECPVYLPGSDPHGTPRPLFQVRPQCRGRAWLVSWLRVVAPCCLPGFPVASSQGTYRLQSRGRLRLRVSRVRIGPVAFPFHPPRLGLCRGNRAPYVCAFAAASVKGESDVIRRRHDTRRCRDWGLSTKDQLLDDRGPETAFRGRMTESSRISLLIQISATPNKIMKSPQNLTPICLKFDNLDG